MKQICGIWLPDSDTHFEKHLHADDGHYQRNKCVAAVAEVSMSRRKTALDIGAHVGLWSRQLASQFEDVIAFEPVPELVECFNRNTELLPNVTLVQTALSDTSEPLKMLFDDNNTGNSHVGDITGTQVLTMRLDCISFGSVDFIKIDVEGWEYKVLLGAERIIKRHKPVVLIEQKPNNAERYGFGRFDALNLLKSWGMVERWSKAGDYCLGWE